MTSPAAVRVGSKPRPSSSREPWFFLFLRRELAPYPGRASLVARMVISATLTLLVANAFQLTGASLGVFFILQLPRDSLRSTVQQGIAAILSFSAGALYLLLGIMTVIDSPVTHFFFVIFTVYLLFFLMGTAKNYGTAAGFAFMVASVLPVWDLPGSTNGKVAGALYLLVSIMLGVGCTVLVEAVYRAFPTQDLIIAGVADRLGAVAGVLNALGQNRRPEAATRARVLQYALIGSSTLRQQLIRSGPTSDVRARATAVISMTSRLVELCAATLRGTNGATTKGDRERLRALATHVQRQASAIRRLTRVQRMGEAALPSLAEENRGPSDLFALEEMERSARLLSLIPNAFLKVREKRARSAKKLLPPKGKLWGLLVPDAYTPTNFVFALRGCLAASLCYLIYNSIAWPGISTSFVTCIITALGSIGASRQKQILRITGAVIGGLLISLPAEAFLLPRMDSISAFTLFFVAVTALSAWVATSSQRLSYCGVQIALAFDLINTNEPFRQTSLSVGRDRVIGILLGLVAMWVVFDRIAPVRASDQMKALLRSTLEKLGDLAGAVAGLRGERGDDAALRCEMLRDKINNDLTTMNGEADAVHFEYGPDRARQLRERERILAMQPAMRSLFLLQITVWESGVLLDSGKNSAGPEAFLKRVADTFHALAAVVSRPTKKAGPGTNPEAEQAVAAAQKALDGMDDEPETIRMLCGTMFFSLRALERAASGRPQF